jgi:hypothetical protein
MRNLLPRWRQVLAYILAVTFFVVVGISVSTQFVLGKVIEMGLPVSLSMRIQTTLQDILGMAPLFSAIFGLGLLISLIVGHVIARYLPRLKTPVFVTSTFTAIVVTLLAMEVSFGITAIAATRDSQGFIALCLVGGLSGYLYAKIQKKSAF